MKNTVKTEYACMKFTPNTKLLEHSGEKSSNYEIIDLLSATWLDF